MWQVLLQNVTVILPNATVITKCKDFITKCEVYYKMRWYRRHFLDQIPIFDIRFLIKMLQFLEDLLFFAKNKIFDAINEKMLGF